MELSRAADYAVRAMVDMACSSQEMPRGTAEIARRQRIPEAMLAKIIPHLARSGLVRSQRGTGGGVWLGRDARLISLLQVVEAMEGPLVLNRCVRSPEECPLTRGCAVHEVWMRAQRQLRSILAEVTIADLAHRQQNLRKRTLPTGPTTRRHDLVEVDSEPCPNRS